MRKYKNIGKKFNKNDVEKNYHKLNEFAFKTGLYLDINPDTSLRAKETLKLLLYYFSKFKIDKPISVADFGSGDGRIDFGLGIYLDNLKRLYVIEINKEANKLIEFHMDKYSKQNSLNLSNKIHQIKGDYRDDKILQKILISEPDGVDIALSAYPFEIEEAIKSMDKIIKEDGVVLTFLPFFYGAGDPDKENLLGKSINSILYSHEKVKAKYNLNLNFKALAYVNYVPYEFIVLTEGKRAKTKI